MSVAIAPDEPDLLDDLLRQPGAGPRPGGGTTPFTLLGSVAIDAVLVVLAGLVGFRLRFPMTTFANLRDTVLYFAPGPMRSYLVFLFLYMALHVLAGLSQDLYKSSLSRSRPDEVILVARSVMIATFLGLAFVYISGNKTIS